MKLRCRLAQRPYWLLTFADVIAEEISIASIKVLTGC